MPFLPITSADMQERGWEQADFVLVTGDAYVDHPSFGTAIIASFMISAKLPKLKAALRTRLGAKKLQPLLHCLRKLRHSLGCWLKAELKLSAITLMVALAGLLLLRIPYAPIWAAAVAVVDAVPLLGTGTVLLPWALVCLIQRQHLRSIGLLCIYGCAFLTRTVLEPRLVGRHLGLDPLVTLIFLYLGYRFWGIWGMLLSPMLAAALTAAGQGGRDTGIKE